MITAQITTEFGVSIKLDLGRDTLRMTVARDDREVIFNLTQHEAEFLADTFNMWATRVEDRKL